jgi:hypothetical protein
MPYSESHHEQAWEIFVSLVRPDSPQDYTRLAEIAYQAADAFTKFKKERFQAEPEQRAAKAREIEEREGSGRD